MQSLCLQTRESAHLYLLNWRKAAVCDRQQLYRLRRLYRSLSH